MVLLSRPSFAPSTRASAREAMFAPSSMLLTIFIASPMPVPPMRMMRLPMASRTGLAFSKVSSSAPHIMVSVPFCAPMVPPETGASMYFTPCSAAIFAIFWVVPGATEDMSTMMVPGLQWARTPLGPHITASTIAPLGSMVKPMSMLAATSRLSLQPMAPSATFCSTRAGTRSLT